MFAAVLERAGFVAVQFLVSASEASMVECYEVGQLIRRRLTLATYIRTCAPSRRGLLLSLHDALRAFRFVGGGG
jgi:hypothetical protein